MVTTSTVYLNLICPKPISVKAIWEVIAVFWFLFFLCRFSRAETFTFPGMMSLCLCLSLIYLFTVTPSCTLPVLRPYSDPAADFKSTEVSLPVQSFLPPPSVLVPSHVLLLLFLFFFQSDSYACRVNSRNYYTLNKNKNYMFISP